MTHYQKMEFGTLVLCGTRHRAELMQQLLREKNLSAFLCHSAEHPAEVRTNPADRRHPALRYGISAHAKLAVLTEGQLHCKDGAQAPLLCQEGRPPTGKS